MREPARLPGIVYTEDDFNRRANASATPLPTEGGLPALIEHACSLALGFGATGRDDVRRDYHAAKQAAIAEVNRLLKPLAVYAETLDGSYPTKHGGEFQITPPISGPWATNKIVTITLADARAAAEALAPEKEESR